MKSLLLMLSLIIATNGMSQKMDSTKSIVDKYVVENNAVSYITPFDLPGKTKKEIKELAINKFTTDPRLSIISASISDDQITGSFKDLEINYKKYGYKWSNITVWLIHPMTAEFVIQFKDDKYRVIVKNVKSVVAANQMSLPLNDFVDKNGKLPTSNNTLRSFYAFGKTMDDIFDVKNDSKKDW